MSNIGKNILVKFSKRWQLVLSLEAFLYAFGATLCTYLISHSFIVSTTVFAIIGVLSIVIIKPWKPNINTSSSFLDTQIDEFEYSTSLLLKPLESLSSLAKLQQIKITKKLSEEIKKIKPPNQLKRSSIIFVVLVGIGLLFNELNVKNLFNNNTPKVEFNPIIFKKNDSLKTVASRPKITEQWVTISYPKYTNIAPKRVSKMDVKALEGSKLTWELKFDTKIDNAVIQSMEQEYPMLLSNEFYKRKSFVTNSGFYNFRFKDLEENFYTSELYALEIFKDAAPTIKLQGLNQFTSFNFDDQKTFEFTTNINDDFGIADAYIIATVSKGSGESVKFREEKLNFDGSLKKGNKKATLSKKIDLDAMNMEPGDELYFYVETQDYKTPKPNISRSETYFAVIKDTTSYEFSVEGNLGVDRMPDYFRSQRQLIIDTEKLIKNRKKLSKKDFNFKSNELGFDQKALRLKYGAFMGEESEMAISNQDNVEAAQHEIEHDSENPLAGYTHDHDNENEHNLVEDKNVKKNKDNPLAKFMHNHDDPEKGTLFEESLRTKLKKALNEMWDAELYLRLYQPEKSLPYQYKALKYIQEIKNSARIYVHRIGFDPPPIKEEKRLSGKLDKVKSYRKNEVLTKEDQYPFMRKAILRLEKLKINKTLFDENDLKIFEKAGNELSTLAIKFPSKHLQTLQFLRNIIDGSQQNPKTYSKVQKGLLLALPKANANPVKNTSSINEINLLLLNELNVYDK